MSKSLNEGKRSGKRSETRERELVKRELVLRGERQEVGQVSRILGGGRVQVVCFDGKQRLCKIRGTMRMKAWVNVGDFVLISLRDYQDDKADLILKYSIEEVRSLKKSGLIPANAKIGENEHGKEGEVEFLDINEDAVSENEAESDDTSGSELDSSDEEQGSYNKEESEDDCEDEERQ